MVGYFLNGKDFKTMVNNIDFSKEFTAVNSIDFSGEVTETSVDSIPPKKKPTWENTVYDLVSDKLGVNKSTWDIYREELAKIESRGSGNYHAKGGANDHYDGRYQLGKDAKIDAAKLLGLKIPHDKKSREKFFWKKCRLWL